MIKLLVIYLLCVALFNVLDFTPILNLITSGVNYITTSSLGNAIKSFFIKIGELLDIVVFNSEVSLTTSTGINLGNLVWLGTILRVVIVMLFIKLIIRLVL